MILPSASDLLMDLGNPQEYERHVEQVRIPYATGRDGKRVMSWATRGSLVATYEITRPSDTWCVESFLAMDHRHYPAPASVAEIDNSKFEYGNITEFSTFDKKVATINDIGVCIF